MLDVSMFLLHHFASDPFLLFFFISCYMDAFFFINNGPLKGELSNFPSCCINNSLTPLLVIPHPGHSYFSYVIDEVLGL